MLPLRTASWQDKLNEGELFLLVGLDLGVKISTPSRICLVMLSASEFQDTDERWLRKASQSVLLYCLMGKVVEGSALLSISV